MIQPSVTSPRWSSTTKLLVGLVIIGIITFLLYRFTESYHPVIDGLRPGLCFASCCWRNRARLGDFVEGRSQYSLFVDRDWSDRFTGMGRRRRWSSKCKVLLIRSKPLLQTCQPMWQISPGRSFRSGRSRWICVRSISTPSASNCSHGSSPCLRGQVISLARWPEVPCRVFGWTLFILTVSYFVMVESNGLREDL